MQIFGHGKYRKMRKNEKTLAYVEKKQYLCSAALRRKCLIQIDIK